MSAQPESVQNTPSPPRKMPRRAGLILVALLAAGYLLAYFVGHGGPEVKWQHDLDAALAQAQSEKKQVVLYLHTPGDPITARNDRELFTRRWAREPLAKAICVRIAAQPNDLIAARYGLERQPLLLLLDSSGAVQRKTAGAPDEREFYTNIGEPLVHGAR